MIEIHIINLRVLRIRSETNGSKIMKLYCASKKFCPFLIKPLNYTNMDKILGRTENALLPSVVRMYFLEYAEHSVINVKTFFAINIFLLDLKHSEMQGVSKFT